MSQNVVNPYRYSAPTVPIAFDSQSYAVTTTNGTTLTTDITIADNDNRILIVSAGSYNLSPTIDTITFGSQSLVQINTKLQQSDGRCDLWYLSNPTVSTDTITCTWDSTAGRRGLGGLAFYNVNSSPIGVTNEESSNTGSTIEGTITPTTAGSMIIDGMLWLTGTSPSLSLTAGYAVNMSNGSADRAVGMQYDLSPTIDSANAMEYTSAEGAGWAWCGVEILT